MSSTTDRIYDRRKKPICGFIVKTIDNSRLPCLREQGHKGGHNPFSDSDVIHPQTQQAVRKE